MKINSVIQNTSFGRAFTTKEREKANIAQEKAKKILDIDKVILINPDTSLPAGSKDYGVGNLNSKSSLNYYQFMKSYAGINNIKMLPQGELRSMNGFYCSYSSSGLTLGSHSINLEELTKEEMGGILSNETFNKVVSSAGSDKKYVNYENVVGEKSPHYNALKEAYENFKKSDSPNLINIKAEFEQYKKDNAVEIENRTLFEILAEENQTREFKEWPNQIDRELFNDEIVSLIDREKRIQELKSKNTEKIDFAFFRQYLADRNLKNGKTILNENGIKLYGDCLIGFSGDEVWSNPKAFKKHAQFVTTDWGLSSLKFSDITDENSESYKLLKSKVSRFAKRYDGIRFDVGWGYVEPILLTKHPEELGEGYVFDPKINAYRLKDKLGGRLVSKIENIVREVKGQDFDTKNLIYEIEAGADEFSAYNWDKNSVIDAFKNRTIVQSTAYLNDGYATVEMLEGRMRIPRDNYVYMVGNHDHLALEALANGIDNDGVLREGGNDVKKVLDSQYSALEKDLKLKSGELKKTPAEFVKAKFSQLFLAKNIKLFFADIFGISEQFDSQGGNSAKNYRLRVPENYEEAYHKIMQNNKGFNLYESLAAAMKAKKLDSSDKKLYKELCKFGKILREKGALTEEIANKQKPSSIKKYGIIGASVLGISLLICGGYKMFNSSKKSVEKLT